ncbi:MAG: hypothetical protein REI09_01795 [Candidatus Dactylopiibacterium sp.]|nr:hypothetical protein [Candidatus Dactylopiibacterium sp.]
MTSHILTGETSRTLVGAIYADRAAATAVASRLIAHVALATWQVSVLHPGDTAFARKLEPEREGIWHTLIRSHVVLGLAGMVLGAVIGGVMVMGNLMSAADSPGAVMAAAVGFCTMGGMMLGGLISLRPDHTRVNERLRGALAEGKWAVVVHPADTDQTRRVTDLLEGSGGEIVRSI